MRTIGLIGGMSWESTVPYYQIINRVVGARLGGLHSAKIVLYSVEFAEIEAMQREGRWEDSGQVLAGAARAVWRAGADFIVLCTNTMHKVAPQIEAAVDVPLLHIADATAARVKAAGVRRVGLLGTRFTMEQDFYRGRLEARHALTVLTPPDEARALVHGVIYGELCIGRLRPESREGFRQVVDELVGRGAEGVILGCTEIGLLLRPEDAAVPLWDTASIHAEAAADYALGGELPS
ncbi:MAG TPA: aspartate/glutamate racemase family protein [Vicinamibacterales bacterium]|nr:aspartate/glutamate racemase family protein [Vicinamibacterales bacterium]HPW20021.1 aspartate/glutamate racemase family protein [Vicinamibacterales bacterium]